MEVAGAVVPPGELLLAGVQAAERVVQAARLRDGGERGALGRRDVRLVGEGGGVVDVDVGRGDVHVSGDDERGAGGADRADPFGGRGEEVELLRVPLAVDHAAVRHVGADDPHPADGRLDPAGLVRRRLAGQAERRVFQPERLAREHRDAGPAPAAVVGGAVAGGRQLVVRERRRVGLRLLQADDVGRVLRGELEHARQASLEGVDVPGDEAHAAL